MELRFFLSVVDKETDEEIYHDSSFSFETLEEGYHKMVRSIKEYENRIAQEQDESLLESQEYIDKGISRI